MAILDGDGGTVKNRTVEVLTTTGPMRQVAVASYAVGRHTAAGRTREDLERLHIFPLEGLEEGEKVPMIKAIRDGSHKRPPPSNPTDGASGPSASYLSSSPLSLQSAAAQGKARVNGRLQLGLGDENSCGIPCRARSALQGTDDKTWLLSMGAGGRGNERGRDGIRL